MIIHDFPAADGFFLRRTDKMNTANIKLIAFDLDGTLTQHKEPLSPENKAALDELGKKYKLIMAGAGQAKRIFGQMNGYPIDIIGNYGLQFAEYNKETKDVDIIRNLAFDCDRESVEKRVTMLRRKYGYTDFKGDNVEYHPSGCVTFPLLGTRANPEDKISFDPDRSKRRAFYRDVADTFHEYNVFVGGSSSFDMAPKPYDKYYALDLYCKENNLAHENVVFVGDDYGIGGNDESVYKSDIAFLCIDNYMDFPEKIKVLL